MYKPRKELPRNKFLTSEECAILTDMPDKRSLIGLRNFAMLKVFLNCGLRKQELIDLCVKDFIPTKGYYYFRVHSKGGTIDDQKLKDKRTILAVLEYLKMAGHGNEPESPLFRPLEKYTKTEGKKISRISIDYMIKKYAKKSGIDKNINAHMLRHSFGTEALKGKKDIAAVQRALRHRNLASTMIYMHADDDRLDRTIGAIHL